MQPWNPHHPTEKGRNFSALFGNIHLHLQNPVKALNNVKLKDWIGKYIHGIVRSSITDKQWTSIIRRFKMQFNKYRKSVTTFKGNGDGWLVDSSLVGSRVTCVFHDPSDKSNNSYDGTITQVTINKVCATVPVNCSRYCVKFDDGDIFYYHIFRMGDKYVRVNPATIYKNYWSFIQIITEPEPCDDPHQKLCLACNVSCIDTIFLPCGHACMCTLCSKREFNRSGICPICRKQIQKIQKMFYSGVNNDEEIDKLKANIAKLTDELKTISTNK
tara:strand:- start:1018 stop:1833 length:816 start_codon:yes stop_codon:yes gene_type:complete